MYLVEIGYEKNMYGERNGLFEFDSADEALAFVDVAVRHVVSANTNVSVHFEDDEEEDE